MKGSQNRHAKGAAMKKSLAVFVIVFFLAAAWAAQNEAAPKMPEPDKAPKKGAAQIVVNGGPKGDIAFPHAKHQDTLKDCSLCHAQFGQEPGVIVRLKAAGSLEPKAVMKACIACHKKGMEAGQKTGPTSCVKCHGTAQ